MLQTPLPTLPLGLDHSHEPAGPTSSEMFRDARNFDMTGCQFINVRGDMRVVEPSNPPRRRRREVSRTACSEYETFFSSLIPRKRGRPLLCPTPQTNLPREYQRRGICIGDVGSITLEGSFDFAFNVYLPASHPINNNLVPEGFCPLAPYQSVDVSQNDFLPGSHVTSSEVEAACVDLDSPDFPGGELHFACQGPDGALVALPYGSRLEKLVNLEGLRQYAARNAESWYRYINQVRGRRLVNGGLYVVTGCEKARSGGMATFQNVSSGRDFNISFTPRVAQDGRASYRFSRDNPAHTRTFESSTSNETIKPNNTVFLRGFTVSLRKGVRRMFSENLDNSQINDDSDGSSDGTREADIPFGSRNSFLSSLSLRFRSSKRSNGGKQASLDTFCTKTCELADDQPSMPVQSRDPSQMINEALLSRFPNATVAITHDDDWVDALDAWSLAQCEGDNAENFLESALSVREVEEKEGAVYLAADIDSAVETEPLFASSPQFGVDVNHEEQSQTCERTQQAEDQSTNFASLQEESDFQYDIDLILSSPRNLASWNIDALTDEPPPMDSPFGQIFQQDQSNIFFNGFHECATEQSRATKKLTARHSKLEIYPQQRFAQDHSGFIEYGGGGWDSHQHRASGSPVRALTISHSGRTPIQVNASGGEHVRVGDVLEGIHTLLRRNLDLSSDSQPEAPFIPLPGHRRRTPYTKSTLLALNFTLSPSPSGSLQFDMMKSPSEPTFYPYVPNEVKHRKRTTRAQLTLLEETFKRNTRPNTQLRERLAAELNLSPRNIQVWFQNRRAKEKVRAQSREHCGSRNGLPFPLSATESPAGRRPPGHGTLTSPPLNSDRGSASPDERVVAGALDAHQQALSISTPADWREGRPQPNIPRSDNDEEETEEAESRGRHDT
ncbi:Pleiotropic drug resistance ABC transporter protein [Mycena indigotica]|uniref:Pleiotropic drug resistance ABC transporter protein n=1 Tax=Mycena indigotica TaxID=2126181 RepID=A0A8H6T916_9AGAR|nr:Pleiotropic drug resistance ABC transporter protein [Mycena indigotica]KAF7312577.1 Pleiotropic drug resistance ABC transporter protein [Mycena indigotica]